jgi:hypothetical protein
VNKSLRLNSLDLIIAGPFLFLFWTFPQGWSSQTRAVLGGGVPLLFVLGGEGAGAACESEYAGLLREIN